MTDPGDTNLAGFDPWEKWIGPEPGALGKERRDQDFSQKVPFVPVEAGLKTDAPRGRARGAVSFTCSNNMTSLSARKRSRHSRATILSKPGEAIVLQPGKEGRLIA